MLLGSYEMNHEHWVPIPLLAVDSEEKVLELLADLEKNGVPHRVLQYRKDVLMVEKCVVFDTNIYSLLTAFS